jgi:hypothetical protein
MLQIEFRDRLHSGRDDEKARVFRNANGRSWALNDATLFGRGTALGSLRRANRDSVAQVP